MDLLGPSLVAGSRWGLGVVFIVYHSLRVKGPQTTNNCMEKLLISVEGGRKGWREEGREEQRWNGRRKGDGCIHSFGWAVAINLEVKLPVRTSVESISPKAFSLNTGYLAQF